MQTSCSIRGFKQKIHTFIKKLLNTTLADCCVTFRKYRYRKNNEILTKGKSSHTALKLQKKSHHIIEIKCGMFIIPIDHTLMPRRMQLALSCWRKLLSNPVPRFFPPNWSERQTVKSQDFNPVWFTLCGLTSKSENWYSLTSSWRSPPGCLEFLRAQILKNDARRVDS